MEPELVVAILLYFSPDCYEEVVISDQYRYILSNSDWRPDTGHHFDRARRSWPTLPSLIAMPSAWSPMGLSICIMTRQL